jgi:hypothetical protein
MNIKLRNLQIDEKTADLLEARAAARGLSVSELLADLVAADEPLSPRLESMRVAGTGPWAPDALADDARRLAEFKRAREGVPWDEIEAWMRSWGTSDERPAPQSRKL